MSLLSCRFFLQLLAFILIQTCPPLRCLGRLRGFCWPRRLPTVPIFPEIVNKIDLFRSARTSCTTFNWFVRPVRVQEKSGSLIYRHICLMNHEKTHQTNPMAPWDPLDDHPEDPASCRLSSGGSGSQDVFHKEVSFFFLEMS